MYIHCGFDRSMHSVLCSTMHSGSGVLLITYDRLMNALFLVNNRFGEKHSKLFSLVFLAEEIFWVERPIAVRSRPRSTGTGRLCRLCRTQDPGLRSEDWRALNSPTVNAVCALALDFSECAIHQNHYLWRFHMYYNTCGRHQYNELISLEHWMVSHRPVLATTRL